MHPGSLDTGGLSRLACPFGNHPGLLEWVFLWYRPDEGNFCYCRRRDSPLMPAVPTPSAHCIPRDLRRWRHKIRRLPQVDCISCTEPAVLTFFLSSVSAEASSPLSSFIPLPSPACWVLSSPLSGCLDQPSCLTCVLRERRWHDSSDCRRAATYNGRGR